MLHAWLALRGDKLVSYPKKKREENTPKIGLSIVFDRINIIIARITISLLPIIDNFAFAFCEL
ncbi:hypothetical protein Scep_029146 [Stephania cephalantha]|uniref:Uncharacterized protein n=1 Tax=Stephania cephalantha TaxID=152367 RepID=A0AAP0DX22_9MAGN